MRCPAAVLAIRSAGSAPGGSVLDQNLVVVDSLERGFVLLFLSGEELEQFRVEVWLVIPVVLPEGLPGEASSTVPALESGDGVGSTLGAIAAVADVEPGAVTALDRVGWAVGEGTSWW